MTDHEEEPEDLTPEVRAYVGAFAERVRDAMLDAPDPRAALETFTTELVSDQGIGMLLGQAFEDGRRDAQIDPTRFVDHAGPSPSWEGVGRGERIALWQESHLCHVCTQSTMCVVQRSIPAEALVQVRRCLAFVPASR